MAIQILLNLMLAFIWMFLQNDWTLSGLIVGYVLGLLIIGAFRRFFSRPFYMKKIWAIIRLLLLFIKELFLSSFSVAWQTISPKLNFRPGIFAYETELEKDWEVTLLACLISLTPGTLTLEVSQDKRSLYIHAMDIKEVEEHIKQIRNTFETAILEVKRA
ncbi:Na+/H+ antiporter subunit E [Paenibacillus septentrionalis]|uniref:Na+/H+ antiporter subunit E n=1 Tax=Paenibacillus septentrionalis TaxID=429342 RepID=A0ABW1V6J7_9BACL